MILYVSVCYFDTLMLHELVNFVALERHLMNLCDSINSIQVSILNIYMCFFFLFFHSWKGIPCFEGTTCGGMELARSLDRWRLCDESMVWHSEGLWYLGPGFKQIHQNTVPSCTHLRCLLSSKRSSSDWLTFSPIVSPAGTGSWKYPLF